jgi:acetyl-CoA carboxylase carboxyl transferase subunit beta
MRSTDPLQFVAAKSYSKQLEDMAVSTDMPDGVVCGSGQLSGRRVEICAMELKFIGGSMGAVVGEKIARAIERCLSNKTPLIIISASGGARMQEGMISLMQLAKLSAALMQLDEAGLPYVSVLTDPTTGGVTASFAMLGDLNIAEPGALIGFAGPRVIEQTIRQKLPDGFQRSEFLLEHGFLDAIVKRPDLKNYLTNAFNFFLV